MSPRARLKNLQSRLEARGITDIKFVWGNTADKPLSQVCSEVADVVEAVLEGRHKPLPFLGDSERA